MLVAVVAVCAVTAGAAACTNAEPHSAQTSAHLSVSPSAPGLSRVTLGSHVGPAVAAKDAIVFPASDQNDDDWDRIQAVPMAGGEPRTVATTQFSDGFINWVAASPDGWIYYVDQSAQQSDQAPAVLWRVVGIDPSSNEPVTLDSNGDSPDPHVPIVQAQAGWAFWTSAEADLTAREHLWKPGWAEPMDLLRHTEMTPGSASVSGDALIYLGNAATGATGHTIGGDCWSVPLAGGTPRPLTHTALAMACDADDDWLVWTQHIGPDDPVPSGDGVLDDPFSLWAIAAKGGTPTQLHQGYVPLITPHVARSVVAWVDESGAWVVQDLTRHVDNRIVEAAGAVYSASSTDDVLVLPSRTRGQHVVDVMPLPGGSVG